MPELKFLPNEAGEGEGLSDAGIETYRADPFPAVARETSQNSRDAHDKENCPDLPVRIRIEKLSVPADTLPAIETYRQVVERCLAGAQQRSDAKELEFFRQARKVLAGASIAVLRIADFNTKGLRGPSVDGTPFHSLVKSSGISNKDDSTSGGSFGIGKSAVYSASDLQTVFYSTSYSSANGGRVFLCQGKTKFRSFIGADGKQYRSIGYWGQPDGYLPIEDPQLAPEWLRRHDTGTTVCSIAVREADDWQNEMTASLLINFFSAIHGEKMEFAVDGRVINAKTIRMHFDDPAVAAAAKDKAEEYQFAP